MEQSKESVPQLLKSLFIALISIIIISQTLSQYVIQPLTFDTTLARSGRYSFSFEAWDTIQDDELITVVGIGSSLTQYALSGDCIETEIDSYSTHIYNLGVPGSFPYLEMIQTERAIRSNPEMILLEINPISLHPISDASPEYIELRIKLNSLFMTSFDYGAWQELLREEDSQHLDGIVLNRYGSEGTYFNEATEDLIVRYLNQNPNGEDWWIKQGGLFHWYSSVPNPNSEDWNSYLRNPTWLPRYLDSMNESELELYETEMIPKQMNKNRYNPVLENNLNFAALEYIVASFSENKIPVLLISYPLHPIAVSGLDNGQLNAHNESLSVLESYDGVESVNYIWDESWGAENFYDFEHLDTLGREKICHSLAASIAEFL